MKVEVFPLGQAQGSKEYLVYIAEEEETIYTEQAKALAQSAADVPFPLEIVPTKYRTGWSIYVRQ